MDDIQRKKACLICYINVEHVSFVHMNVHKERNSKMQEGNLEICNKKITDEEYKDILLNIMESIDKFCRENNIKYFMLGGTMLGAVRHKGFIPWDDDIDIGMLRSDYELFCRNYKDDINKYYQVISIDNNEKYYLPAAKVIDTRTSLMENLNQAIMIGAYIDVFPLDYVEPNKDGKFEFFTRNKLIRNIESLKKMRISRNRSLWKNILVTVAHMICRKKVHTIATQDDKRAKELSYQYRTTLIANYHGAWKEREIMDSSIFDEISEYDFCGRKFYGVKDYDTYLTKMYGNYMKLPPKEKRVTHHDYTVEWKR